MKYRDALRESDLLLAVVTVTYSLLAGGLAIAALMAAQRSARKVALCLVPLACAAIALPAVVPSLLPRSEWGRDPVLSGSDGGPFVAPGEREITACFEYAVEDNDIGPGIGPAGPTLCLRLRPTPEARRLVARDPPDFDEASIYDIEHDLNSQKVRPYDEPEELDVKGMEIADARWNGIAPR